ncbi:hypothetical protein PRIPAC_90240, partial [Pristionchus pacificus]
KEGPFNHSSFSMTDLIRTPDEILASIGKKEWMNLTLLICLTSLGWSILALIIMPSSFYDTKMENSTFITVDEEFHLNKGEKDMISTVFMAGMMLGGLSTSPLSDRLGRKPMLIVSSLAIGLLTFLVSKAPNYGSLILIRVLQGACYTSLGQCSWTIGFESTPIEWRAKNSLIYGIAWVLGYLTLTPIAYLSRSWRDLFLFTSIPPFIFALAVLVFVPETLHHLARINSPRVQKWIKKVDSRDAIILKKPLESVSNNIFKELWEHKRFLHYTILTSGLWIADTFIYFGLSFYSTNLSGNIYFNYAAIGAAEIPAYFLLFKFIKSYSRRKVMMITHFLSAISFVIIVFLPKESIWSHICWYTGKMIISISFMTVYVAASEIFPTNIRNSALGICEMISRIGGIMAPFLSTLVRNIYYLADLYILISGRYKSLSTNEYSCFIRLSRISLFLLPSGIKRSSTSNDYARFNATTLSTRR